MHQPEPRLRVGIVGSGGMAAVRAQRVEAHPDLTLLAIAARNLETRGDLARRYDVPALGDWQRLVSRDDLDLIVVTTHPDTHAAMTLAALEHGKHVFTESPLALAVEDADGILQTARARGRVVRVGHTSPFRPNSRIVAEQAQRLGGPVMDDIRIQFLNDARAGRSAGFDLRISGHPLLYAVLLGLPAIHGRGPIAGLRAWARLDGGPPVFERCVARLEVTFVSGAMAGIAYLRGFDWPGPGRRTVTCPHGRVRLLDGADHVEVETAAGTELIEVEPGDPWAEEIEEFVRAIRDNAPMSMGPDDARRVLAIAAAAETAARTGRPISGDL